MGADSHRHYLQLALRLARRGYGTTSPNPMVGAVLVKAGRVIGQGWHRRAGLPHAEIEAIRDAERRGYSPQGATLYVTLEPCCTHGRTPPCTQAILAARIRKVVVGATDPNPSHSGKGFKLLSRAGVAVEHGVLAAQCEQLNEAFNHWITRHTPFVTVKAAMTLDGKLATASGQSKWITGPLARTYGMHLRAGADAILVGINTVLADNPSLTVRPLTEPKVSSLKSQVGGAEAGHRLRRIVLDAHARTPLTAKVASDEQAELTTIAVSDLAPKTRVAALAKRVRVLVVPLAADGSQPSTFRIPHSAFRALDLRWLLRKLGSEEVTSLLVEGGGEVNASFLLQGLAQRVVFFYAPKVLGGRDSRHAVAGEGTRNLKEALTLTEVEWQWLGPDLMLRAIPLPG